MKSSKLPVWLLLAVFAASFCAGGALAQLPSKAPKKIYTPPEENFGFVPPPLDLSHIQPVERFMALQPPASWDWRSMGGVTSVKNQNPYGTCWAFAAIGNLESQVVIDESIAYDYSELNVVACNVYGTTCNSGGNYWQSTNYLAKNGSVDETCDPYPGGCPTPACINPACTFYKQVIQWKLIPNDVTTIKNAVMNYGPVATTMYASFPAMSGYDGSFCLTYTGTEEINHGVLIVGWDDAMCDGNGGWIVKNSWGTGWGDNGYFYIRYGNARIGEYSSVITSYKDYDADETIYYWDEWGWWTDVGYNDGGDDWGMVEITPATSDLLYSVDFWANASPTPYDIYVYDDFDGSQLSNVLVGPITGTVQEAGYYSIDLPSPLSVSSGNAIYLAVRFKSTYGWPVPVDDTGPMETNKCFVSNDGVNWIACDNGYYALGDVGIRGRIAPLKETGECSKEGDPCWYDEPFDVGTMDVYPGAVYCFYGGPANVADYDDTFCVHVFTDWTAYKDPDPGAADYPDLDECFIIESWYAYDFSFCIEVPCDAEICEYDTVIARVVYCNVNEFCDPTCTDDVDPSNGWYSNDTLIMHVVEAPPALYIEQDSVFFVDKGQTAAYVPFGICNGDPCAPPTDYGYCIDSRGWVGGVIHTCDTVYAVPGGECTTVYGVVDAGGANVCDYDTLTIIAWSLGEPVIYDTCVQLVHVIEPTPVPLFTTPVVTILVLTMILAAAVFMKRRAAGRI